MHRRDFVAGLMIASAMRPAVAQLSAKARSRGKLGHWLTSGRYQDFMPAPLLMVSATRARGDVQCLHSGEPKRVQWGISAGA